MIIPEKNQIYRHFKGNSYRVITLAEHSETGEPMVVYEALYDSGKVYVRPLASFMSKVDRVKYPDVEQEYRFCLVEGNTVSTIKDSNEAEEKTSEDTTRSEYSDTTCEAEVDQEIMEFLEAKSCRDKMTVLQSLREHITEEQLITIAVSLDMELPEGDLDEKYNSVKNSLLIMSRFEDNRLR